MIKIKNGDTVRITQVGESFYTNPSDWYGRDGVVRQCDSDSVMVELDENNWGWYKHYEYKKISNCKFWMVLRNGSTYTNVRHDTYQSASQEARRLAMQYPSSEFYVLELVLITNGKVVVEETDV